MRPYILESYRLICKIVTYYEFSLQSLTFFFQDLSSLITPQATVSVTKMFHLYIYMSLNGEPVIACSKCYQHKTIK